MVAGEFRLGRRTSRLTKNAKRAKEEVEEWRRCRDLVNEEEGEEAMGERQTGSAFIEE